MLLSFGHTSSVIISHKLKPPSLSHWPEKYAKYHVFSGFEAEFCSENENTPPPPPLGLAMRSCEGLAVIHLKLVRKKNDCIWAKTFFYFIFYLEITPIWTVNRHNLIQDRLKSGSRSFVVFSSLQNSPPKCKFVATRQSHTLFS